MSAEIPTPAQRRSPAGLWIAVSVVAIIAIAGASWWFLFRPQPYEFKYGFYEPAQAAPELSDAVDQHGQPFSFSEHEGKVIFVYFGYTHCPDACPATLDEFMEVKEELGDKADDVEFVMITVDPSRDTPERLTEYLDFWDPEFYGVSMPQDETDQIARDWAVTFSYEEKNSRGGYMVNHEVSSFVIDKEGNKRLTYPLGSDPSTMSKDVEYLLKEKSS